MGCRQCDIITTPKRRPIVLTERSHMDDTLLKAISTTGFPIAVSCYLLVKLQTTLERFSTRLDDLIVELRKGYYTAKVQP